MADWKKFKWKREKIQKVQAKAFFSSIQSILCWPVVPGDIFGTLPVAGGQIYNRPTWLEFVRYTHIDPPPQKQTQTQTQDPTPQKESDQQTNQEEGCVSGGFPQFRYIYVACLCWFRRITVPSCALRPSNYLWIIISSDNLPWMDTRTKIFLHKIDLTLSPSDPDYRLCINYNFPPDFSATFDDGGFPQSAFLLSLSQTNKGRTNFQEIVHSIQIWFILQFWKREKNHIHMNRIIGGGI